MGEHISNNVDIQAFEKRKADDYNNSKGDLEGYDCAKCKNRGKSIVFQDKIARVVPCECIITRRNLAKIEYSGLKYVLDRYTMSKYLTNEKWQESVKKHAMDYIENNNGRWFFIGGSVGSGKSHICTAICKYFLENGKDVKYMVWIDEVKKLNACVNDYSYEQLIKPLKKVEVLYIDDFIKTRNKQSPNDGEINRAIELINHRYNNNLITIISCEWTIDELNKIDEALASRIFERTEDYKMSVIGNKNQRTK